jgi:hypothetical protein
MPGQGLVVTQNTTVTLTIDDTLLSNLYEEVPDAGGDFVVDDPGTRRTALPQLLLTTVDESLRGSVAVLIGGISVSYLNPGGDGSGNYEIDLDEDLLMQLWPFLSAGSVDIRFNFASEGDSFQLATADDYQLDPEFAYDRYGLGLTFGFQVAIDVDGDEDIDDAPAMDGKQGKCSGDPGYDPAADLNGDGCITESDLSPIGTPVIQQIEVVTPTIDGSMP